MYVLEKIKKNILKFKGFLKIEPFKTKFPINTSL